MVTNGYWGTAAPDAELWLRPLMELGISDLSISDDELHRLSDDDGRARTGFEAADRMGVPSSVLETRRPRPGEEEHDVMFRGRAFREMAPDLRNRAFESLDRCPEGLEKPGRVHVDPLGYVHVCQGVVIGNIRDRTLAEIVEAYDPAAHPIVGPLMEKGPVELVERYGLPHSDMYADVCDLCYEARLKLRTKFPELLAPDAMYGDRPE